MAEGVCPIKITRAVIINICLIFLVLSIHIVQGIILDTYIIQAHHTNNFTYFWMIPDFLLIGGFASVMVQGFRYSRSKKENIHKTNIHSKVKKSKSVFIASSNFLGKDGAVFWIWLMYSIFFIMKIIYIFITPEIQLNFDQRKIDILGPQTLHVMLATPAFIFVILVQRFNSASPSSNRSNLIMVSILENVLDILDSATLLSLLIEEPSFPQMSRNAVLVFSCFGFILPCIPLLSLTRSSFGQKEKCVITEFIYRNIQLWLVNIPFLVMRMHLWIWYEADISALPVKNVIFIFLAGRIGEMSIKDFYKELKEQISYRRNVYDMSSKVYDTSATVSVTSTTLDIDKLDSTEASFNEIGDSNGVQK